MPAGMLERELRELASTGDGDAFAELVRRCLPGLYDFAARLLADPDAARPLLVEAITELAGDPRRLAINESFRGLAFAGVLERALEYLRKRGELAGGTIVLNAPVDPAFCRSTAITAHGDDTDGGTATLVWQVAASLDRRQYAVLDLWTRQRLTATELALALGLTHAAVDSTAARMEKAVETAMTAVVVSQRGRRWCRDLDVLFSDDERLRINEATRRRVEEHIQTCHACEQTAQRFGPSLAVFRSLQPLALPSGLRSAVLGPALEALAAAPANSNGSGDTHALRLKGRREPVVSATGRIEPIPSTSLPRAPQSRVPHPHLFKRHRVEPTFRAARVPVQSASTGGAERAYSYTPQHAEHRLRLYSLIAGVGVTALAILIAVVVFVRGDGSSEAQSTVAEDSTAAAVDEAPAEPSLSFSATDLDFGASTVEQVITLESLVDGTVAWTIEANQGWLTVNPTGGSSEPGQPTAVLVTVDRQNLDEGPHSGVLNVTTSEGESSEVFVQVLVPGTGPTIGDERVTAPREEETGILHIFKAGCEPEPTAFRVSAIIDDPSGVSEASLVYTVGGGEAERTPMAISTDRYEGSIPPLTRGGPIVFYIEAADEAGNASASAPVTVEIRDCAATAGG